MKSPKICVVGVGGWGKNHLRALRKLNALKAFCDIDESKVSYYEEVYGVKGHVLLDSAMEEDLDGAVVSTPASSHHAVSLKVIRKNLGLLVEKPLAVSEEEALEIVKEAKRRGVVLAVGHIERFNQTVIQAKRILQEGLIGTPLCAEFVRESPTAHVKDVGVVLDMSIHDIDLSRWFFESDPVNVYAKVGGFEGGREHVALLRLNFEHGASALIFSSWLSSRRVRYFRIMGTEGVVYGNLPNNEVRLKTRSELIVVRPPYEEPLEMELTSFLRNLTEGSEPEVGGEDGLSAVRIALLALESSKSNSPLSLKGKL